MYQKEWDRLEKGLLKGLNGYVDRVQYIGALSKSIPQIVGREPVAPCASYVKYNDTDYNQGAVLGVAVYISSENSVDVCEEKIGAVLEQLGYALTESKPFSHSCDNGPIIMRVAFQRTISMDRVTYALDEDGEQ